MALSVLEKVNWEDIFYPSRKIHCPSEWESHFTIAIWTTRDKPYLMEISLMKIKERWECSKLMLWVMLKIASQNEGVAKCMKECTNACECFKEKHVCSMSCQCSAKYMNKFNKQL